MPRRASPSWSTRPPASIRPINLYPGDYEVTVARRGFAADPQKIKVQAGARVKADFVLKDADPAPKAGINGPSTVVGYPGRATITDKDVEFSTDYDTVYPPGPGRQVLEQVCMSCHGVNFFSVRALGSRRLGRRHRHDEQAHRRHGYIGPARPAVAEGPPAPARLSRDQHRAEREEARARDRRPTCRSTRRRLAKAMYVEYDMPKVGAERASDRTEPVFRQRRQRLDDRPRHAECDRQARSAHGEIRALSAARARHPARHHGRFQGHDLVGRDRRLQVRPPRSQDREDGPLSDRSERLSQGPRP